MAFAERSGRWLRLHGSDPVVTMGAGGPSIWQCIAGSLEIRLPDWTCRLHPGMTLVVEEGPAAEVRAGSYYASGVGLQFGLEDTLDAMAAHHGFARQLCVAPLVFPDAIDGFLPCQFPSLAAAHDLARASAQAQRVAEATLLVQLAHHQSRFDAPLARCRGKSSRLRRYLLLRLQRARMRVEIERDTPRTVPELARIANLSLCHFIKVFGEVYGERPYQFILRERLVLAHQLIERSNEPVSQIAFGLGFKNRCAFSRAFSRTFGYSPLAVRRRECSYLPMQKLEKIAPSRSSLRYSPVISDKSPWA